MNHLKNPILNFRFPAAIPDSPGSFSYDLLQGEHKPGEGEWSSKYDGHNACTMVTLTREAADSSENSGQ